MLHHNLQSEHPLQQDLERTVNAAAEYENWAWTALIERFGPRVRSVGRRYGLAAHDVEDVAQMTWISLYEHIDSVREPRAIGSWLETTARRESLRVLRSSDREQPTDDELIQLTPVEPVDERRIVAAELRTTVQASIARLTERQCALMRSLLVEPAPTYADVARSLGMPPGSIGPTRLRCLERLRTDRTLAAWCSD